MLHGVDADQGASAAETSLAVNSNSASIGVGEVLFAAFDEAVDYILGRNGAIYEEEVLVLDSILDEGVLVVFGIVESDNFWNSQVLKDIDVACTWVSVSFMFTGNFVDWSHEGKELTGNYPV